MANTSPKYNSMNSIAELEYINIKMQNLTRLIRNKNKGPLEQQLSDFLDEFIRNFPGGYKNIIHMRDNQGYKLFQDGVLRALAKVYNGTKCGYTLHNGKLVESMILQSLSKLEFPLEKTVAINKGTNNLLTIDYQAVLDELIDKINLYFNSSKNASHYSHTLSALTNLQFKAQKLDGTIRYPDVENIIKQAGCFLQMPFLGSEHIIRILHSTIILSMNKHGFSYPIDKKLAKELLEKTNEDMASFDINNIKDQYLARQLFVIKAIYNKQFPSELERKIACFIPVFQQNTHGSTFEKNVFSALKEQALEMSKKYSFLNASDFHNSNPVSQSLGLESDITYANDHIKVSIQVDGNKYHKYPGSGETTRKTLLRDHCFSIENWKIINITDNTKDYEKIIIDHIIIPTFEERSRKHFKEIDAAILDFETTEIFKPYLQASSKAKENDNLQRSVADLKTSIESYKKIDREAFTHLSLIRSKLRADLHKLQNKTSGNSTDTSDNDNEIRVITSEIESLRNQIQAIRLELSSEKRLSKRKQNLEHIQNLEYKLNNIRAQRDIQKIKLDEINKRNNESLNQQNNIQNANEKIIALEEKLCGPLPGAEITDAIKKLKNDIEIFHTHSNEKIQPNTTAIYENNIGSFFDHADYVQAVPLENENTDHLQIPEQENCINEPPAAAVNQEQFAEDATMQYTHDILQQQANEYALASYSQAYHLFMTQRQQYRCHHMSQYGYTSHMLKQDFEDIHKLSYKHYNQAYHGFIDQQAKLYASMQYRSAYNQFVKYRNDYESQYGCTDNIYQMEANKLAIQHYKTAYSEYMCHNYLPRSNNEILLLFRRKTALSNSSQEDKILEDSCSMPQRKYLMG